MGRQKRPYSIQKRPTSRKNINRYYVKFRNPETDEYITPVSSGCTNKDDAVRWAEKKLREGTFDRKKVLFKDYVVGFWDRNGRYAQGRIVRNKSIASGTLDTSESNTRNHLVPKWGDYRINAITTGMIDSWVIDLAQQGVLSPNTINKIIQTLRTILSQAVRDGIVASNAAREVQPIAATSEERGSFTLEELQRLFASTEIWPNFTHYIVNLLTAATGMRIAEVRGLCLDSLKPGELSITRSWEQKYGFKDPKYGSFRDLPLAPDIHRLVNEVIARTEPECIVFYGRRRKDRPLSKSAIQKHFRVALERIGIGHEEQVRRGLCFHSYRHSVITLLGAEGVSDRKINAVAGHKSGGIQERYTHFRSGDLTELADFQRKLMETTPETLDMKSVS